MGRIKEPRPDRQVSWNWIRAREWLVSAQDLRELNSRSIGGCVDLKIIMQLLHQQTSEQWTITINSQRRAWKRSTTLEDGEKASPSSSVESRSRHRALRTRREGRSDLNEHVGMEMRRGWNRGASPPRPPGVHRFPPYQHQNKLFSLKPMANWESILNMQRLWQQIMTARVVWRNSKPLSLSRDDALNIRLS